MEGSSACSSDVDGHSVSRCAFRGSGTYLHHIWHTLPGWHCLQPLCVVSEPWNNLVGKGSPECAVVQMRSIWRRKMTFLQLHTHLQLCDEIATESGVRLYWAEPKPGCGVQELPCVCFAVQECSVPPLLPARLQLSTSGCAINSLSLFI